MDHASPVRVGAPPSPPDPVFVDRTGRRRRLTMWVGVGAGTGLLAILVLIVVGLLGGSSTAIPGWPTGVGPKSSGDGVLVDGAVAPPTVPTRQSTDPGPTTPTRRSIAPSLAGPQPPSSTSRPGQGAEHRATPGGRNGKSPGKVN